MSVHYAFPIIRHIDDVLPHIDDQSFRVIAKDSGHTFINYVRMGNDTFPPVIGTDAEKLRAAIRRECRGIAFNTATGLLESRPFHKFFNVGENEYVTVAHMRFDKDYVLMDKLDGSMLRPLRTEFGMRWGTKMGITDTSNLAEVFVMDKPEYDNFAAYSMRIGFTPLFEYMSPENRIVVDYGKRAMILIGMRDNLTGVYMQHDTMCRLADTFGIPVVRTFAPMSKDADEWIADMKSGTDFAEGVVWAWNDGHRAKGKTDLYNILHKVKEAGRTERTLILALLDGRIDDLLAMLSGEDRAAVDMFIKGFWATVDQMATKLDALYTHIRDVYEDKKAFALSDLSKNLHQVERAQMFALWDGKSEDGAESALGIIRSGLSSETAWHMRRNQIESSTHLGPVGFDWGNKEYDE